MFLPKHGTALTCIDGRVQMPVIRYMKARYALDYVDIVSEPGVNLLVAETDNTGFMDWTIRKINLTIERHGVRHIAVVGHHDCAANPATEEGQAVHTLQAIDRLRPLLPEFVEFCGLWVNARLGVSEVRPAHFAPLGTAPRRKA